MLNKHELGRGFAATVVHYLESLVDRREYHAAITQLERSLPALEAEGGPEAAIAFHLGAKAQHALANYPPALKMARRAQARIAADGDRILLAEICMTTGAILRDMGAYKEAEKSFHDAESIFRRNDNIDGQSCALNQLAGLMFRQTEYRAALTFLVDALELAEKLGDKKKLAYMLGNIGRIHTFTGDFGEAEKHIRMNLELSSELGDQLETARAGLSLAYVYIQQADYMKAEDTLTEAYRAILVAQSKRDEVIYLTYLGELQYRQLRYEDSRITLEKALSQAEAIGGDTTLAARVVRHLAELAVRQNQARQAARYIGRALPIFEAAGNKVEAGALWKLKAQVAELNQQTDEARKAFRHALDLLGEAGVRWELAEVLMASGQSSVFSVRERTAYLFRAEEYYSRTRLTRKLDDVGALIGKLDTVLTGTPGVASGRVTPSNDYLTAHPAILQFKSQLAMFGKSDLPILLTGETGVGKDQMARYYHALVRPDGPFKAINCASVPETLLESELFGYRKGAFTGADGNKTGHFVAANGGVLFLDEIGDMPLSLQVKLLGVLEKRCVVPLGCTTEVAIDVRLVAATNQNLEQMVERGTFRRDLYYRLSGISFHIPALRERKEDVPILLHHFMVAHGLIGPTETVPASLLRPFVEFDWPGNIRELDNKVRKLGALSTMVAEGDLTELACTMFASVTPPSNESLFDKVEQFERRLIMEALLASHGNKCEAARLLGVHEATVRLKAKRYGLSHPGASC